jgi:hypothetical protein
MEESREAGMRVRREVLGDAHVDHAGAAAGAPTSRTGSPERVRVQRRNRWSSIPPTGTTRAMRQSSQCTKGLPHNELGEVDADAYRKLLKALQTGETEDFDTIPRRVPHPTQQRKLVNPQSDTPSTWLAPTGGGRSRGASSPASSLWHRAVHQSFGGASFGDRKVAPSRGRQHADWRACITWSGARRSARVMNPVAAAHL